MPDILIAFPKINDANNLKRVLIRNAYDVTAVCDSGVALINKVNTLDGGIVICGYKFQDMHYREIYEYLPDAFRMLLIASPAKLGDCDVRDILKLEMPIRAVDFLNTVETMLLEYERWYRRKKRRMPRVRSEEEQKVIAQAKELLILRNGMTEEEAHRYIQKLSMDSGNSLSETAAMLMDINGKEWS